AERRHRRYSRLSVQACRTRSQTRIERAETFLDPPVPPVSRRRWAPLRRSGADHRAAETRPRAAKDALHRRGRPSVGGLEGGARRPRPPGGRTIARVALGLPARTSLRDG